MLNLGFRPGSHSLHKTVLYLNLVRRPRQFLHYHERPVGRLAFLCPILDITIETLLKQLPHLPLCSY
jgi:hypothetical protein